MGAHFNEGNIVENNLITLHCPLVEDITGNVFWCNVDALCTGFVEDIWEQTHLELEPENINLGDVILTTFEDDFFYE